MLSTFATSFGEYACPHLPSPPKAKGMASVFVQTRKNAEPPKCGQMSGGWPSSVRLSISACASCLVQGLRWAVAFARHVPHFFEAVLLQVRANLRDDLLWRHVRHKPNVHLFDFSLSQCWKSAISRVY
jgi:hypothetical protein